MHEAVRERAVVREEEGSGRVGVEPADRDDTERMVHEVDDSGPAVRVARMADGWLNNITDPKVYRDCLEKIRGYAAEAGRDPRAIEAGLYFTLAAGDDGAIREGENFLSQYYNRPYEAVAKAMLCVMGSWDRVMDRIQAYHEAGASTVVLRFASSDQIRHLEECAEQLARRGLAASFASNRT